MSNTIIELTPKDMAIVIREEGFFPHIETDGDVSFKLEGTTFTFGSCAKGFVYGRLYYHLKREDKWPAILAAQHVELSLVAIKALVVPDNEYLIFSVESLCAEKEGFRTFFIRSLSILRDAVKTFADKFLETKSNEYGLERNCRTTDRIEECLSDNNTMS